MTDDPIRIRSIQQFLYCPRRWGYIDLEREWRENAFVVRGEFLHERVDGGCVTRLGNKIVERSVYVYHDGLDIWGVADQLEFTRCRGGVFVSAYGDTFSLKVVEYKPTAPRDGGYHVPDAMQLLAQKLCVEYRYGGPCAAELYYADRKRRVAVSFSDADSALLSETLLAMRGYRDRCEIPARPEGQACSGCSFKNDCLPRATGVAVKGYLLKSAAEDLP